MPRVIRAGAADKFNQNEIQLTITHKVEGLNDKFKKWSKNSYLQINLKQIMCNHSFECKIAMTGAKISVKIFHLSTIVINLTLGFSSGENFFLVKL